MQICLAGIAVTSGSGAGSAPGRAKPPPQPSKAKPAAPAFGTPRNSGVVKPNVTKAAAHPPPFGRKNLPSTSAPAEKLAPVTIG